MSKLDASYLRAVAAEIEAAQESERSLVGMVIQELRAKRHSIIRQKNKIIRLPDGRRLWIPEIRAAAKAEAYEKTAEWLAELIKKLDDMRREN